MLGRAGAVWFAIMLTAILNGAVRDFLLVPRMGDPLARAVSCITLASMILGIAWVSISWMHPRSAGDAWRIGMMWLAMTLIFEFGAGHYLFHTPWPALLADYNVFAGRLWILVLLATLTAPALTYRPAQNPPRGMEISSAGSSEIPQP